MRALTVIGPLLLFPLFANSQGTKISTAADRDSVERLGALPASFSGQMTCAHCPGYELNLFPDGAYFLRVTYIESPGARYEQMGRWVVSDGGGKLTLMRDGEPLEQFEVKSAARLRRLNMQGYESDSELNYDLQRTLPFERLKPRLEMRGMFREGPDAPNFTECETGQRWPVAMEADYNALESAYLTTQRQPGEDLLVTVDGQVTISPGMEGNEAGTSLIVEKYLGSSPRETCSASASDTLGGIHWKLTNVGDQAIAQAKAPEQKEPYLVFSRANNHVDGSGACNYIHGKYHVTAIEMRITDHMFSAMACEVGMELDLEFFGMLDEVRRYRVSGNHLEFSDENGATLARFEAVAPR